VPEPLAQVGSRSASEAHGNWPGEDFRQYAREREAQADFMAGQSVDIADDTSKDTGFGGNIAVAQSRLRVLLRSLTAGQVWGQMAGTEDDSRLGSNAE
jgi:hypothetical protein